MGLNTHRRGRLTREEVLALFADEAIKRHGRDTFYTGLSTLWRRQQVVELGKSLHFKTMIYTEILSTSHTPGRMAMDFCRPRTAKNVMSPYPPRVLEVNQTFPWVQVDLSSARIKGKSPCSGNRATTALYAALDAIGVKGPGRAEYNLP